MPTPVPTLDVHFLPQFVGEAELAGGCVVMIDLLRASTTICHALAAGASAIYPLHDVSDVVDAAEAQGESTNYLLAGERGCKKLEGFDLGNSPSEYTADQVFGKKIFFTTTNGTAALVHSRLARRVLIGCAANLSAVVDTLVGEENIHLLCAGTDAHVSREDQLIAGAIAYALHNCELSPRQKNEASSNVIGEWEELLNTAKALGRTSSEQLGLELRNTPGGKNLLKIGMEEDLDLCSRIDTHTLVPEYDLILKRIEA